MTGNDFREDGGRRITTMPQPPHDSFGPHGVEQDVRRRLLADPRLHFSSLVVRRVRDGVCLEGVVETDGELDDVDRFVGSVRGVNTVLNRLVLRRPATPPKG